VTKPNVVPLGVDLELFAPSRRSDRVRASYGAGPEKLVLMYAGRLSNEKRVSLLVEALLKLPADLQAVLWLVGHGPMHEDIEAMTALVPSLRLLPYETDRARFAAMLASADIYVTAGPHETFALSVIEAQASGLPAVGIDAGALRDRIPPGTGYLGPVDDADAMAANIVRTAAERSTLGAQARSHVEQHFSWDNTFHTLLGLYSVELERRWGLVPSEAPLAMLDAQLAED
jgi:alpha-1,6-mannosyltransferase